MKLLKKVGKWFNKNQQEAIKEDYYRPKLFGKSKSVTYEIEGLAKSYCTVTAWANGEGFDISFETQSNTKTGDWEYKRISLHDDELDVFFACLNHLKYFKL
jgi:hypothetical protein